jgi:hypothetical protein
MASRPHFPVRTFRSAFIRVLLASYSLRSFSACTLAERPDEVLCVSRSGRHAGVASSNWLSVNCRTSLPSARMTYRSPYGCGPHSPSIASSLKPLRELVNTIQLPSADQMGCASFPWLFVSFRTSEPSGRVKASCSPLGSKQASRQRWKRVRIPDQG